MVRGIHTNINPVCRFCGETRKNDNSRMNHERFCKNNPNKVQQINKGMPGTFRGKKHSTETKLKISESRKKFLLENPDKVPNKQNPYSKGPSYPEKYFTEVFLKRNLNIISEYRIGLYSLDFAIPEKKIDIEIDGDQHYLDDRILSSDNRRTLFLEKLGWKVHRIRWSDFQKLNQDEKIKFIDYFLNNLDP